MLQYLHITIFIGKKQDSYIYVKYFIVTLQMNRY